MENSSNFFTIEAETLTALAHPSRLEILELLRDGERCVCHIQAVLDQRQAYVSQHLNILRQAGLVINRKEGKRVYYQISDPNILDVIDSLKIFLRSQKRRQIRFPSETLSISPRKPCNCPQCALSPA
jgi:ArsR family transcriptional regulator